MKKIEFLMSKKFRDYAIENCTKKITANKIVPELLKNDGITKPRDLRVGSCSIADLKYKGKNIIGASMNIIEGKIFLEIE